MRIPVPIIPILLYHGKDKWNKKSLYEYFPSIDYNLELFIPEFNYILLDLSEYSDEDLKHTLFERATLETALLLMKNIFDEEKLEKNLADYLRLSKMYLEEEKSLKFLHSIILYLLNTSEIELSKIVEEISSVSPAGGEYTMSTATKLIELGELKGYEKGYEKRKLEEKQENNINTAKKMFSLKFSVNDIIAVTGLSAEEIELLQNDEK